MVISRRFIHVSCIFINVFKCASQQLRDETGHQHVMITSYSAILLLYIVRSSNHISFPNEAKKYSKLPLVPVVISFNFFINFITAMHGI